MFSEGYTSLHTILKYSTWLQRQGDRVLRSFLNLLMLAYTKVQLPRNDPNIIKYFCNIII